MKVRNKQITSYWKVLPKAFTFAFRGKFVDQVNCLIQNEVGSRGRWRHCRSELRLPGIISNQTSFCFTFDNLRKSYDWKIFSQGRYLLLTFSSQCSNRIRVAGLLNARFVLVHNRFLVSGIRWIYYACYTPMRPWWSINDEPVGKKKISLNIYYDVCSFSNVQWINYFW